MAFFGVTQLGFQNYIREHSVLAKEDPVRGSRQLGYLALPPLTGKTPPPRSIKPENSTARYGPGHEGSFGELTTLRTKHCRRPTDPQSLYYYPPTTAAEPGWWNKDNPIHTKRPWTHVPRRPQINSEMTRFVNIMVLTNRQFTLF
ncbi:sperm microtubule inner protein 11-like [Littorina saxatilis]|uniref:Uncharacterized protein n=1 Tax=Littorina saxatilis TaxID=31220 RepID=A0AAN9ASW6_9CAEN